MRLTESPKIIRWLYRTDDPSASQAAIRELLAGRVAQRMQAYDTRLVPDFSDDWRGLREPCILGAYSHIYQGKSRRREVRILSAINLGTDLLETPPTVARDYLSLLYGWRRSLHQTKQSAALELCRLPSFAYPATFRYGLYIDIISTYMSIMKRAGWDVDYKPFAWLAPGRPPFDFPFQGGDESQKVARSALVSVAQPGQIQLHVPHAQPEIQNVLDVDLHKLLESWWDTKPVFRFNQLKNPSIMGLIADVLACIALEASDRLKDHLIYWNTDGAIVTSAEAGAELFQIIESWGLEARIKGYGPGLVRGRGSYIVGNLASRRRTAPHPTSNLEAIKARAGLAEWLKPCWLSVLRQRGWLDTLPDVEDEFVEGVAVE